MSARPARGQCRSYEGLQACGNRTQRDRSKNELALRLPTIVIATTRPQDYLLCRDVAYIISQSQGATTEATVWQMSPTADQLACRSRTR